MTDHLADEGEDLSGGDATLEDMMQRRLRECLSYAHWSGGRSVRNPASALPWAENVCLLGGLDPEMCEWWSTGDCGTISRADDLCFLPGGLASYGFDSYPRDWSGLESLALAIEHRMGALTGLRLPTSSPGEAVRRARAAGFSMPWWDAALADPECRAIVAPLAGHASEGGNAKRDDDKQYGANMRALRDALRELQEQRRAEGEDPNLEDYRKGQLAKTLGAAIASRLERLGQEPWSDRNISRYIPKLLRDAGLAEHPLACSKFD